MHFRKYLLTISLFVCMLITSTASAATQYAADKENFDPFTGVYTLDGHVVIFNDDRKITADYATANIYSKEVWGKGSIVMTEKDMTISCPAIYVNADTHQAKAEEGIDFKNAKLAISAAKAVYDWNTRIITFMGDVKVVTDKETSRYDNLDYDVETGKVVETK